MDLNCSSYVALQPCMGIPLPSNPTEALAISSQERETPVSAADGVTVVDWLTVSSGEGPLPTPPADESGGGA
jgi:hypothetical protein